MFSPVQEALVAEAEAEAERDGLVLASQLRLSKVILESDNSTLANALKSTTMDRSLIASLWYDITELCRSLSSFKGCSVSERSKLCST